MTYVACPSAVNLDPDDTEENPTGERHAPDGRPPAAERERRSSAPAATLSSVDLDLS